MVLRLGACITRRSSPFSALSCRSWSLEPSEDVATALVVLGCTGECGGVGLGTLAGSGLSVLWDEAARRVVWDGKGGR